MLERLKLFGIVLAIPVIALVSAEGIQRHFDGELRTTLRRQHPDADPAAVGRASVAQVCAAARADGEEPDFCTTVDHLRLMSRVAIGGIVLGLVLLLGIRWAGRAAESSRDLLVRVFRPGLRITTLLVMLLIVVDAVLALATIYYGEAVLIERIHVKILLLIAFAAAAGVFGMVKATREIVKTAKTQVLGKAVARDEAPALWSRVDELADRLGALRPEHIVVGLDPNFFVTEADVVCLDGPLSGRTLYCSLPLSRILSTAELSAVIGHELGHFKGEDTKFSEHFYPIYRGTQSSLASLHGAGISISGTLVLMPAIAVLDYFLESFAVAERRIGRDRELAADEAGASVTDAPTIASALVKVHAFSGVWAGLQHAAAGALREGKAFVNASSTYADAVAEAAQPEALTDLRDARTTHPTDSHPPLGLRLDALGVTLDDVADASLAVSPADAAITLLAEPERLEEEISGVFHLILARDLGIELPANDGDEAPAA